MAEQLDRKSIVVGAVAGILIGAPAAFLAGRPIVAEPLPSSPSVTAAPIPTPPPRTPGSAGPAAGPGSSAPGPRIPPGMKPSFAQQGEDLAMKNLLDLAGIPKPSYLDVGAHDPIVDNSTFLFTTQGGGGVLVVEPGSKSTAQIRQRRPNDTVVELGAGALKLDAVIEEHFEKGGPELLAVDVDGKNLAILKTLDFTKHRPKVICVATIDPQTSKVDRSIAQLLESKGYQARGGSLVRTIFVEDKTFDTIAKRLQGGSASAADAGAGDAGARADAATK